MRSRPMHVNIKPCACVQLADKPFTVQDEEHRLKVQRAKHAIWQCIPENIYTYRRRKKATELNIMICNCKKPPDGQPGCGEDCLNRTFNHECNAVRPDCSCSTCKLQRLLLAPSAARQHVCSIVHARQQAVHAGMVSLWGPV